MLEGRRRSPARYRLTLAAMPSDLPAEVRLKAALKRLRRSYSFRCERLEELVPRETPRTPVERLHSA